MDYRSEAPQIIAEFLIYHETVKGHSKKTVDVRKRWVCPHALNTGNNK